MSIYSKAIVALALLFTIFSQVQADEKQHSREGPRQRPCFSSLDSNSDGDINFNEFSSHKLPRGDHETVFTNIDSDANGMISKEEFKNHKPPHNKKSKGSCDD